MKLKHPKQIRRIGIIINFKSLVGLVILFELMKMGILSQKSIIFELIPFAILIISYIVYFGRTGLWKFTHKSVAKLDEREVQLSNRSLRFSYSVFTILSLSLFLIYNLLGIGINVVLIVSLIYIAHILPSYFISWTEKPIIKEE